MFTFPSLGGGNGCIAMLKAHLQSAKSKTNWFACVLLLTLVAQPSSAQNLVINGSFDQDVSAWGNPDPPAATWSSPDANGSATSGSAQLLNNSAAAGTRLYVLRQCFVITQSGLYRVEVAGLVSSQTASGRLVVSQINRTSADCSGGFSGSGGYFIQTGAAWQRTQFELPNLVVAGGSIELLIGIEKDAAGGNFVGNVDDVKLVLIRLFANGFE
jgi:hypothetical protein